jgi:hypothetical protein
MSGKNNVNKDFYTIAGRDRPNEALIPPPDPEAMNSADGGRRSGAPRNFIPGAAPVGETPVQPRSMPAGQSADGQGGGHDRRGRREPERKTPARPTTGERRGVPVARGTQTSAGKTGTRSGARKSASANRGGNASGKARPKAGASGKGSRRPANTARAKRGTTRAAAGRGRRGGRAR